MNTAEETFRLPLKTKQKFYDEVAPVVGNGISLGITNGTNNYALTNTVNTGNSRLNGGVAGSAVGSTGNIVSISAAESTFGITTNPAKSGIEAHLTEATLYLYFYVGETVQNANLIDAGRIGEQLATKADKTEVAPLKTSYIVDTYINGTSGYRIYSDGYCEHWGQSTTTNGTVSITFVKPLKTVVGGSSAILNSDAHFTSVMNFTTTGCTLAAGRWASSGSIVATKTTAPLAWVIYGYLADGQY